MGVPTRECCPYCGCPPKVLHSRARPYSVRCQFADCPATALPVIEGESVKEAVIKWNAWVIQVRSNRVSTHKDITDD